MPVELSRRLKLSLILLGALALASATVGVVLGASEGDDERRSAEATRPGPAARTSFLARVVPAEAGETLLPPRIAELIARLPLERRVAQLFALGFEGTDASAEIVGRLRSFDAGALVIGRGNYVDPAQLEGLTASLTDSARRARHLRPLVLTSQEGGELNSLPGLPPAQPPADLASASQARAEALASGRGLRALGVTGVLGPLVDVGAESGSALGARVYSDVPEDVGEFAREAVGGYEQARVFSSVAHLPGLGGADQSTQDGPATVGLELDELRERDLIPFEAAIGAGVPAVTLAHALYPFSDFTVPASLSRTVATELLRDELGFDGVALTDDLADPAITALLEVPEAAVEALRAGADMLFISGPAEEQEAAYAAVLRAVRSGRVSAERVERALGRILVAKRRYAIIR